MIGLVSLAICVAIYKSSDMQPQQNAIVQFTLHLPTLKCQLEAYKILGNRGSGYFDSGDAIQQQLWALAQRCHGSIEATETPKHPFVPQGPARNG